MFENFTTALIPARGGSKSIPRKNLQILMGKPLIAHSIESALKCPGIRNVVVSTDSTEIADIAKSYGAEVPFLRPTHISQDLSTDLEVFDHYLQHLKDSNHPLPEILAHFRPTSPFRKDQWTRDALNLLKENPNADSLRFVTESPQNPYKMWTIKQNGFLDGLIKTDIKEPFNQPRQRLPKTFWQTGTLDLIRTRTILNKRSMTGEHILPFIIESDWALDIDTPQDLLYAEFFASSFLFNKEPQSTAIDSQEKER